MRHWSCESILEKNDKYKRKIKIISNRMLNLEKDIQEIKKRNISPFLSTKSSAKNSKKNFTMNFNNFNKKEEKIHYISLSDSNSNNMNLKEEKDNYISNFNSNSNSRNLINSIKEKHCCKYSVSNNKQKCFSHNSSKTNIHNNNMRRYNGIILSKEELDYEFEIRNLKRKLEELKKKNEKINNKLYLLKEKNDNLEFSINSYRKTYETINDSDKEERKNSSINSQINVINNKRKLIDKIMDIYKRNIFNFNFSFISNKKSKEDYSILNMLLNLMDMKIIYENSILNDAFLTGVDLLYQANFPKYSSKKRIDKIFIYTNNLISQEKNLENIKKYYVLYHKFSGIKNMNNFINELIMRNIKVEQKIDKIKKVLNFEKAIKGKEKENEKDDNINNSKIIKNIIKRNQNKSFNYDNYSFYATKYYKNKNSHYNYNKYRNNNFLKYAKNTDKLKYNNILKINKIIANKTNSVTNNKNIDKNNLTKNEKLKSKSLSKKKWQKIL